MDWPQYHTRARCPQPAHVSSTDPPSLCPLSSFAAHQSSSPLLLSQEPVQTGPRAAETNDTSLWPPPLLTPGTPPLTSQLQRRKEGGEWEKRRAKGGEGGGRGWGSPPSSGPGEAGPKATSSGSAAEAETPQPLRLQPQAPAAGWPPPGPRALTGVVGH